MKNSTTRLRSIEKSFEKGSEFCKRKIRNHFKRMSTPENDKWFHKSFATRRDIKWQKENWLPNLLDTYQRERTSLKFWAITEISEETSKYTEKLTEKANNLCKKLGQLSSPLCRSVWSAVKRLDTTSQRLQCRG